MYVIDIKKFFEDLKIFCIKNGKKLTKILKDVGVIPQSLYYIKNEGKGKITKKILNKLKKLEGINVEEYITEEKLISLPDNAKEILGKQLYYYYKKKGRVSKKVYDKYFNN